MQGKDHCWNNAIGICTKILQENTVHKKPEYNFSEIKSALKLEYSSGQKRILFHWCHSILLAPRHNEFSHFTWSIKKMYTSGWWSESLDNLVLWPLLPIQNQTFNIQTGFYLPENLRVRIRLFSCRHFLHCI